MGASLADVRHVLDFGCGCARTLRWLKEIYPATKFYGADVDGEAIAWCVRHIKDAFFVQSSPNPPLPFESAYFDIVYCFSVFTHLDEPMQDRWLVELRRVLKSGGILILTVHGARAAADALDRRGAESLSRDGFVHQRSRKLNGIVPDWYNTSWHSQNYIVGRVQTLFIDVRYTAVPDGMQDFVTARVP
jgi:SAM-dependent methyltransferase